MNNAINAAVAPLTLHSNERAAVIRTTNTLLGGEQTEQYIVRQMRLLGLTEEGAELVLDYLYGVGVIDTRSRRCGEFGWVSFVWLR